MEGFSASELAAELARRRTRETRRCAECGEEYQALAKLAGARYCSPVCRHKAWTKANKERIRWYRMERYRKQREGATDGG